MGKKKKRAFSSRFPNRETLKRKSKEPECLATATKVDWKKNGLRHSFISYRVAECADVPRLADECGNSPAIIRTNYLQRVKPKQAQAWFGIMPVEAASTIPTIAA